jgi:hypothetical protein
MLAVLHDDTDTTNVITYGPMIDPADVICLSL